MAVENDDTIVATNGSGVGISRKRLRELIEMQADLSAFQFKPEAEDLLPPPLPNATGRYVCVERRGEPSQMMPVDDFPKDAAREFTPAERRPGPSRCDFDFDVFGR